MWSCTAEWLRHRRQINEAKPMLITALESFRWRQARSSVSAPELNMSRRPLAVSMAGGLAVAHG